MFRECFRGDLSVERRFTALDFDEMGAPVFVRNDSDLFDLDLGNFTIVDNLVVAGRALCGPSTWRIRARLNAQSRYPDSFAEIGFDSVDVGNPQTIALAFRAMPRNRP